MPSSITFSRYTTPSQFASTLRDMKVYRAEFIGDALLESLEAARLLIPRVRIHLPDAVARRLWLENHEGIGHMAGEVEPDGPRWDAALGLLRSIRTWSNPEVYGASDHPIDSQEAQFSDFIEDPTRTPFEPWSARRVEVSNDRYPRLYDTLNVRTYYSTWQLLVAAEAEDAGVHIRIDLRDQDTYRDAWAAARERRLPDGSPMFNLRSARAVQELVDHEKVLDSVVWFAEESSRALRVILRDQHGGRFRLTSPQAREYEQARSAAARSAFDRFHLAVEDLMTLNECLVERWADWDHAGRPLVANVYKEVLGQAAAMTMLIGNLQFDDIRRRIGVHERGTILDEIWPDWVSGEQDRVRRTLRGAAAGTNPPITDAEVDAFVRFLSEQGLESFFWRLRSFEEHTFRGNAFALEAMKSDLQGMSIAVEHVAAALGATELQLYEKFKQLWNEPDVLRLLRANDQLARQVRLAQDWPTLKVRIDAVRAEPGGAIASDLIMAHRIRAGVHAMLPEDDQFELEGLFVTLMRAGLFTFVEVERARRVAR